MTIVLAFYSALTNSLIKRTRHKIEKLYHNMETQIMATDLIAGVPKIKSCGAFRDRFLLAGAWTHSECTGPCTMASTQFSIARGLLKESAEAKTTDIQTTIIASSIMQPLPYNTRLSGVTRKGSGCDKMAKPFATATWSGTSEQPKAAA
tara:strand:- start:1267 stop:1713 length:447 start_codon:yes stop_codon:yes gene_type:complete